MMSKLVKGNIILSSLTTANIFAGGICGNNAIKKEKKERFKNEKIKANVNSLQKKLKNIGIEVNPLYISSIIINIYEIKNDKYSFIKDANRDKLANLNLIAEYFGKKQFSVIFFEDGTNEVFDNIYNEKEIGNDLTQKILELKNKNKTFYVLSFTGSRFKGFDYSTKEEQKESNLILDIIENPITKSKKGNPKQDQEEQKEEQKETLMEKLKNLKKGSFKFVINENDKEAICKKENTTKQTYNKELEDIDTKAVEMLFDYLTKYFNDFNDFKDSYLCKTKNDDDNIPACCFNSYIFKVDSLDGVNINLTLTNTIDNNKCSKEYPYPDLNFSNENIYIGFLKNIMFKEINEDQNNNDLNKKEKVYFRFLLINDKQSYDKFKEYDKESDKLIFEKQNEEQEDVQKEGQEDKQDDEQVISYNINDEAQ